MSLVASPDVASPEVPALDVASLNAEQSKLSNMELWINASGEGQWMEYSKRLPIHNVGTAWPFESRLMNMAVLQAEAGKLPPVEVLFLLSACSEGGAIEPGMQPARDDALGRIDRLCAALEKLVERCPGDVDILRSASARTLAEHSHRLWLEEPQPQQQHQEQQHQPEEELMRVMFSDPPAVFAPVAAAAVAASPPPPPPVPAPAFVAGEPEVTDDQGGDWQPQFGMALPAENPWAREIKPAWEARSEADFSYSSAIADAVPGELFAPIPALSSWMADPAYMDLDAILDEYYDPPSEPKPEPEPKPETGSAPQPLDDDTAMELFGSTV